MKGSLRIYEKKLGEKYTFFPNHVRTLTVSNKTNIVKELGIKKGTVIKLAGMPTLYVDNAYSHQYPIRGVDYTIYATYFYS